MLEVSKFLKEQQVLFLDSIERDDALEELSNVLCKAGRLRDPKPFFEKILERERLVSTTIGNGVAITHAKLAGLGNFVVVIGVAKEGIDWHALDGRHVRLIFMIGGPEDKPNRYLDILSALTLAVKEDEHCRKLLEAETAEEFVGLLKHYTC